MNGFEYAVSGSCDSLQAQSHIWNHILHFINSASLKSAVQLRIPDIIHKHGMPMTLAALADAIPVHSEKIQHLYRLMRVLIKSGFFAMQKFSEESNDEQGYVLTPTSHFLLSDNPSSVAPFLLAVLDHALMRPWDYLRTFLENDDQSLFETAYGKSIWEQAGQDPQLNSYFNDAMASDTKLIMPTLLEKCRGVFEGLNSLVDVGGGTGTMANAIASAFPDLKCINFDLPHVVAGLEGTKNMKHVEGDMFKDIPPADAILLKWILHDWSDEQSVKVLVKCKDALQKNYGGKGGKLIIIDMVVDEGRTGNMEAVETQLFFDMVMMALATGREREEKEWAKLFKDAGFRTYKINPVLGLRSIIEVYL